MRNQQIIAHDVHLMTRFGAPAVIVCTKRSKKEENFVGGKADRATGRKASLYDTWHIASVTKLFTAVLVHQLIEQKKGSYEDVIDTVLPGIVPFASNITLSHLLQHTSGVPDYLDHPSNPWAKNARTGLRERFTRKSDLDYVRDANNLPRPFPPGLKHRYSNTNYLILGQWLETITSQPYQQQVREKILAPLGLFHTGFPGARGRIPVPYLHGYIPDDTTTRPYGNKARLLDISDNTLFGIPDGGMYSSASDLVKLLCGLTNGSLIQRQTWEYAIHQSVWDEAHSYRYGLGVMGHEHRGGTVWGHEGRGIGYSTNVFTDTRGGSQYVAAITTSTDPGEPLDNLLFKMEGDFFAFH